MAIAPNRLRSMRNAAASSTSKPKTATASAVGTASNVGSTKAPVASSTTSTAPSTSTNTSPSTAGLSDYVQSEIKRKAEAGLSLDSPNAQKSALYDYYKGAKTGSGSIPKDLAPYQKALIDHQNGVPSRDPKLGAPNPTPPPTGSLYTGKNAGTTAPALVKTAVPGQVKANDPAAPSARYAGMSNQMVQQIYDKAAKGISLDKPTDEKVKVYQDYLRRIGVDPTKANPYAPKAKIDVAPQIKYAADNNFDFGSALALNDRIMKNREILKDPKITEAQRNAAIRDASLARGELQKMGVPQEWIIMADTVDGGAIMETLRQGKQFKDYQTTPYEREEMVGKPGEKVSPYAKLDYGKIEELNKIIYESKSEYALDPVGSKKAAEAARIELEKMGVPADLIMSPDLALKDAPAFMKSILDKAGQAKLMPNVQDDEYQQQQIRELDDAWKNPGNAMHDPAQEYLDNETARVYEEEHMNKDTLKSQLEGRRDFDLMSIENALDDGVMALKDTSFQDWMASRQAMSDRGIAGSGLATEQDTRLAMNMNRSLAQLYRDASQQKYGVNNEYSPQLNQIDTELSKMNLSKMQRDAFLDYFLKARDGITQQQGLKSDYITKMAQFYNTTQDAELASKTSTENNIRDNDTNIITTGMNNDTQKYGIDVNAATDKYNTDVNASLSMQQMQQEWAKAVMQDETTRNKNMADIAMAATKELGYVVVGFDKNGTPIAAKGADGQIIKTLGMSELELKQYVEQEQIKLGYGNLAVAQEKNVIAQYNAETGRMNAETSQAKVVGQLEHWSNQSALAEAKLRLDNSKFDWTMKKDIAKIEQAAEQIQNSKDKTQVATINSQLLKTMASMDKVRNNTKLSKSEKAKALEPLVAQQQKYLDNIDAIFTRNGVSPDGGGGDSGGGSDPFSQLP